LVEDKACLAETTSLPFAFALSSKTKNANNGDNRLDYWKRLSADEMRVLAMQETLKACAVAP